MMQRTGYNQENKQHRIKALMQKQRSGMKRPTLNPRSLEPLTETTEWSHTHHENIPI